MSLDKRSISEMENLISLMEGVEGGTERIESRQVGDAGSVSKPENKLDAAKKDMTRILSNFTNAVQNAEKTLHESKTDKALEQVGDTVFDEDTNSLCIGDYRIHKGEDGFTLLDEHGSVLLKDILLYETVYCIASHLYRGSAFNSSKVLNLLSSNNRYEKYVTDARINKHNYNKYKHTYETDRLEIEKSRFDENKSKARIHKKTIVEEYKRLGK